MSHQDQGRSNGNSFHFQDLKEAISWLWKDVDFSELRLRNDSTWSARALATAALFWAWSDELTLGDRFRKARQIACKSLGIRRAPATSYQAFLKLLNGVLTASGEWRSVPKDYLFPVKALSIVFRAKVLAGVERLLIVGKLLLPPSHATLADPLHRQSFLKRLAKKKWVVYSKRPFAGSQRVLDYLGRYTHRVAISNNRILRGFASHFQRA